MIEKKVTKMLNEERKRKILELTNLKGSISINDLMKELGASESTVRRDLIDMDSEGLIKKVHGGAVALKEGIMTRDLMVAQRQDENKSEKEAIARYSAELIKDDDIVYLDAGTTTYMMIPYLKNTRATFVTNGVSHAMGLSMQGHQVYVPGGILKKETEAIIGQKAAEFISEMNFTLGFFGTNGISFDEGFSTPDIEEGMIKQKAFEKSRERYILSDSSKFDKICSFSFGNYKDGIIITTSNIKEKYRNSRNTLLVDKL